MFFTLVWMFCFCGDTQEVPDLNGKWQVVSYVRKGKPIDSRIDYYLFDESRYSFIHDSKEKKSTFVLSYQNGVCRIETFAALEGKQVLATRGILKLEGNTLSICYGDPYIDGYPFPKNFTKAETDKGTLAVLKRVSPTPMKNEP